MEEEERNEIIKAILNCIGEAIYLDSDDSDKEEILDGLTDLCLKATYLSDNTSSPAPDTSDLSDSISCLSDNTSYLASSTPPCMATNTYLPFNTSCLASNTSCLASNRPYLTSKPTYADRSQCLQYWKKSGTVRGSPSFLTIDLQLSDDASYKNYLRMSKTQFEIVLNLVQPELKRSDKQIKNAVPAASKLALALRFLASGEVYPSDGYQTRVSKTSFLRIIPEVCYAICNRMKETYMKFPSNPAEWEQIAAEFANKWEFPNCLGALNEKLINFNVFNNIILLTLVDANCKFLFVDAGRSKETGVFSLSTLRKVLKEEKEIPPNSVVGNGRCLPYVVLGNDAFTLQTHLMKPYPSDTNSRKQEVFNARLSYARHVVEHAFGILANQFRVLVSPVAMKVETVKAITFACCILHNFLLETDEDYINKTADSPSEMDDNLVNIYNPQNGAAESVRQQFLKYFCNEGKVDWI